MAVTRSIKHSRRLAARNQRALGSVGAIVAGALMWLYGWYAADPLFSALIGILIVWSSWRLIRESTNVLLEGTPAHIDLAAVEDSILRTEGVDNGTICTSGQSPRGVRHLALM